jgi:uncharacterized phage-associated protein
MKAKEVAEYFISLVDEDSGDSLSNLKIQKLLYYAQGFSLAILRCPLFDEKILAWNFGPVVEAVYEDYKQFGSAAVPLSSDFNPDRFDPNVSELLNEVYGVYGQFSAAALVEMTHSEPPWKKTKRNNEVPLTAMQDYFSTQVNNL